MSGNTVYAVASGKGGVGKTTTTVNLGTALAGAGNRVAIVDVDLGMANLAGFVSLNPEASTLHEVLAGEADVMDVTYELADGICAVPSGIELDSYADVQTENLTDVVEQLRAEFDYVILDVGAGVSHETVLPLGLADSVLLVTTPEPAAIQDARKTIDLTDRAGGTVEGLVITRTHPESDISYETVAERLSLALLATIPEDARVRESIYAGTPLVVHAADSPASKAYKALAARLTGHSEERGPTHFGEDDPEDADPDDVDDEEEDPRSATAPDDPASSGDVSEAISEVDEGNENAPSGETAAGDDVVIPDAEHDAD